MSKLIKDNVNDDDDDFWTAFTLVPIFSGKSTSGGIELGLCASVGSSTNLLSSYGDDASSHLNDIVSFLLSFPSFIDFINSFHLTSTFLSEAQHPIPTNTFRIPPEYRRITMEHIEANPALEAQPNFESAAYRGWLNALLDGGATREEALAQMAEGWGLERQERIEAWQQQKEDEAREFRPFSHFSCRTMAPDMQKPRRIMASQPSAGGIGQLVSTSFKYMAS
ncbi:hypothetical protein F4604DRAFT_1999341 [Suillus subluteus]|nr:hypothetical protein F4604DRAFT_1999341 [Suillus subluteus]